MKRKTKKDRARTELPEQKPEAVAPKGNGKVGDAVVLGGKPGYVITRVGILNDSGYPLDVEIRKGPRGPKKIVSPFDGDKVRVFPNPREVPRGLKGYAKRNSLTIVRRPSNRDHEIYRLICNECRGDVSVETSSVEWADLFFEEGEFRNGKFGMEDGNTEVRCSCRRLGWPDGFEPYY
ncbi:MAG: hypothetical protein HY548_09335 [Elusimicrobia bacterium]|nr:hypothetical protein [Elusimicrobiota bacterium]